MQRARPKPILNASLPAQFRRIRIELAREPDHPDGDASVAYTIVAPFDQDDRLDATLWRRHRTACRAVRSRPGEDDDFGHLVHRQGGDWAFHYDGAPDEIGFHFGDERFVPCEYVSINEAGKLHTYRVVSVSHL